MIANVVIPADLKFPVIKISIIIITPEIKVIITNKYNRLSISSIFFTERKIT
jgi:hypothetical protein